MRTTVRPGSVVVGVDGSRFSDAAVEWAAAEAVARRTPLTLVHAVGDLGGYLVPLRAEARHMAAPVARRIIEQACGIARRTCAEVDLETRTVEEDPRQALLGVEDASMLVVGTRGHGPIAGLLLGSVSQALVSHASCPVTVVRPADQPPVDGEAVDGDEGNRGTVVVGVDVDGGAGEALEVAFEIASRSRRPLEVLHAATAPDQELAELAELAELLAGYSEKYPDVQVTTQMTDDAPAEALVHASQTAAHLVVGGPDARRGLRHLGSLGRTVVEHSHCPVTVIPPPAARHRERR